VKPEGGLSEGIYFGRLDSWGFGWKVVIWEEKLENEEEEITSLEYLNSFSTLTLLGF